MSAIVYISPDLAVRQAIERYLTRYGYLVAPASTTAEGLRAVMSLSVSAVIFDTASPGEPVAAFMARLRSDPVREHIPFLIITGSATARRLLREAPLAPEDVILERPVRPASVLRGVERALAAQRSGRDEEQSPLRLDRRRQTIRVGERQLRLTPTEFRLLAYLADHAGDVVTYDELLEEVWGYARDTGSAELVRTHIMNVRRKLAAGAGSAVVIRTVPRVGYQLEVRYRRPEIRDAGWTGPAYCAAYHPPLTSLTATESMSESKVRRR